MDPIADLLNGIKNAQKAGHESVVIPFSKVKFELARILNRESLIASVQKLGSKNKEKLELKMKYNQGIPAIQDLRRVSKPGQRIYAPVQKIKPVKQGYGLAIISTSSGLMTDKEARKNKLGGEILCEIW